MFDHDEVLSRVKPAVAEALGGGNAEREQTAARLDLDLDLAQDRMRGALNFERERGIVERGEFIRMNRIEHPDQA